MSSTNCHRCTRLMASAFPTCPHCGAPQDEPARAESARRNRETLFAIVPAIGGAVAGWLVFTEVWAIIGGLVGGLLIGIVIVAVVAARRPDR